MDKLKPCPFCGEDNAIIEKTLVRLDPKEYMYRVRCDSIHCDVVAKTNLYFNIEDAVEIWNRRSDNDHYRNDKKGEWLINSDGYYPYCSECRYEPIKGKMTNFCPECGAKMECESDE